MSKKHKRGYTPFVMKRGVKKRLEYEFKYCRAAYTDKGYKALQQTYKVVVREYEKYKSKEANRK